MMDIILGVLIAIAFAIISILVILAIVYIKTDWHWVEVLMHILFAILLIDWLLLLFSLTGLIILMVIHEVQ